LFDLTGCAVGLRISLKVPEKAVAANLEQAGLGPCASALDRAPGGLIDREKVAAISARPDHAQPFSAAHEVPAANCPATGGGLGVTVVLDHEHHRQLANRREIERLEELTGIAAAITDEAHGDHAGL